MPLLICVFLSRHFFLSQKSHRIDIVNQMFGMEMIEMLVIANEMFNSLLQTGTLLSIRNSILLATKVDFLFLSMCTLLSHGTCGLTTLYRYTKPITKEKTRRSSLFPSLNRAQFNKFVCVCVFIECILTNQTSAFHFHD